MKNPNRNNVKPSEKKPNQEVLLFGNFKLMPMHDNFRYDYDDEEEETKPASLIVQSPCPLFYLKCIKLNQNK